MDYVYRTEEKRAVKPTVGLKPMEESLWIDSAEMVTIKTHQTISLRHGAKTVSCVLTIRYGDDFGKMFVIILKLLLFVLQRFPYSVLTLPTRHY